METEDNGLGSWQLSEEAEPAAAAAFATVSARPSINLGKALHVARTPSLGKVTRNHILSASFRCDER